MEYVHNSASKVCNYMNTWKDVFVKCQPGVLPTHKHQVCIISFCTSSCLNHSFMQRVCSSLLLLILCSVSVLNPSRFYHWMENGAILFRAHDIAEAAFKRDFMVFIYRKKKACFFPTPNKFLSIIIHGSKQKEDLGTQMNKTKTKLLYFSDPRQRNHPFLVSFHSQGQER